MGTSRRKRIYGMMADVSHAIRREREFSDRPTVDEIKTVLLGLKCVFVRSGRAITNRYIVSVGESHVKTCHSVKEAMSAANSISDCVEGDMAFGEPALCYRRPLVIVTLPNALHEAD